MKNIKKTFLSGAAAGLLSALLLPSLASAATFTMTPSSVPTNPGKFVTVVLAVDSTGSKTYTAKAEVKFPADLLEVRSFSFGANWMPLAQSGYDLIDNTNGVLVKTAGYPGGLSANATFGTVSFYVKKAGQGTIQIGQNSLTLDSTNQNSLAVLAQSSVSSQAVAQPTTPAPTVSPKPVAVQSKPQAQVQPQAPVAATQELTQNETEIQQEINVPGEQQQEEQTTDEASPLTATIGDQFPLRNSIILAIAAILILAGLGYYSFGYLSRRG